MPIIVAFLGMLAKWLMSGIIARLIISLIVNGLILGSIFMFAKNFSSKTLDYALSMFDFFGWTDIVQKIEYYYNQLPSAFMETLSYFQFGPLVGMFVNSYIASIFLAWVMRRFG